MKLVGRVNWGMVGILLLAAALRFVGLSFGQPDERYMSSYAALDMLHEQTPLHPDAFLFTAHPLEMFLSGNLKSGFYENPSMLINLNFVTFALTGVGREVSHETRIANQRSRRNYAPFSLYMIGRIYSALGGLLTVAGCYWLGRRLATERAAIAAGLLAALALPLVQHAHYAVTSSLAAGFTTLCMVFAWQALKRNQPFPHLLLSGIFAGLATGNRYNAAVVSLFVLLVGLVLLLRDRSWRRIVSIGIGYSAFPIIFLMTTPAALLDTGEFVRDLGSISGQYLGQSDFNQWLGLFYEWRYLVIFGIGIPASLCLLVAVLYGSRRFTRWAAWRQAHHQFFAMLVLFVGFYSVLILRTIRPTFADHLLLPIMPAVIVLAALGFDVIAARLRSRWLVVAAYTLFVIMPLVVSASFVGSLLQPDTREELQAWIYDTVPRESNIVLIGPYNVALDAADYTWQQHFGSFETIPSDLRDAAAYFIVSDALRLKQQVSPDLRGSAGMDMSVDGLGLQVLHQVERPIVLGTYWPLHTATYFHNPSLTVYCVLGRSCAETE